jgi:hemerythrin
MDAIVRVKHRQCTARKMVQTPVFGWRDSLSLGVPAIDKDHRRLIDLLNRLPLTARAEDDGVSTGAAILDLEAYVQHHFHKEEMLMRLCGYPGYQEHCRMHRALTARVADFRAKFRKDPAKFDVDGLYEFLAHWLAVHISREDMKIQPYVENLAREQAA